MKIGMRDNKLVVGTDCLTSFVGLPPPPSGYKEILRVPFWRGTTTPLIGKAEEGVETLTLSKDTEGYIGCDESSRSWARYIPDGQSEPFPNEVRFEITRFAKNTFTNDNHADLMCFGWSYSSIYGHYQYWRGDDRAGGVLVNSPLYIYEYSVFTVTKSGFYATTTDLKTGQKYTGSVASTLSSLGDYYNQFILFSPWMQPKPIGWIYDIRLSGR